MNPGNGPTEAGRVAGRYAFAVLRYDASRDEPARFQEYELEAGVNVSVLEGLFRIREEQDPSLAFRSACRGAVCGSCAMSINGRLDLACRVLLKNLGTRRVVLEPLPHFRVIKDLVLDMDPFWERYARVQPYLQAEIQGPAESRMSEAERERIDQYVNCILCGLCYGACPVLARDEAFTGPAALAKLYRFLADTRERRGGETLEQEDSATGVWGCHTITRCIQVCPRQVRPTDGIEGLRRRLVAHRIKRALGISR
jgi:succinate dehydrogenase / fumarate reductase iron-sulfur subunit